MENDIKYKVIKSEKQYNTYCNILDRLVFDDDSAKKQDEIELLTLLIENWDKNHKLGTGLNPVKLLKALMNDHGLNQTELADIAGVGKSYISEILNYKKKMSKKVIRNIANYFKIRQEILNKPYHLDEKQKEPVL
jgi:HTH-type transcriptional regulator/antitoxin HigA